MRFRMSSLLIDLEHLFFFVIIPPPPRSTLFPYTTLFRSYHTKSLMNRHLERLNASMAEKLRIPIPGGRYYVMPSGDRKSTRLNSSHLVISYAVFCLKKKKTEERQFGSEVSGTSKEGNTYE